MRHPAALLLIVAAVLGACGGDDGADATSNSTTTTVATTAAPVRYATASALARIVAQIDDPLRRVVVDAELCLASDGRQCEGGSIAAYRQIPTLVGALSLLEDSVTEDSSLYAGELPPELVGRFDATLNARAAVLQAMAHALETCIPDFPPACADANQAVRDSLIDLYKVLNEWRRDL